MATVPKKAWLDPFTRITNVGWGNPTVLEFAIECFSEEVNTDLKPMNCKVQITGDKTYDPLKEFKDPSVVTPDVPVVRPFTQAMFTAYRAWTLDVSGEPSQLVSISDNVTIVTEAAVVILPVAIPNPFASHGEAEAWIASFRATWPGYTIVPFFISDIPAGETITYNSIQQRGKLYLNLNKIATEMTVQPLDFKIKVDCEASTDAIYTARTYRGKPHEIEANPQTKIAEQEVKVGRYLNEFEQAFFRPLNVEFTVDRKTLAIAYTAQPAVPTT